MSHIVFVVGRISDTTPANVNCCRNVMKCIQNDGGHKVSCIYLDHRGTGDIEWDGIPFYAVSASYYEYDIKHAVGLKKALLKIKHFFMRFAFLATFPNREYKAANAVCKKLEEIDSIGKIDAVVSAFYPYTSIIAMHRFCKNHKAKSVGYYLDLMMARKSPFGMESLYRRYCRMRESKYLKIMDLALFPPTGEKFYNIDAFPVLKDKVEYVDFPTFVPVKTSCPLDVNKDSYTAIYAGTMDSSFRNPEYSIRVLIEAASRMKDRHLTSHFYGSYNLSGVLEKFESLSNGSFKYHGAVDKQIVDCQTAEADFIVNIANSISGFVPSKIFEMMATGKPIIHFTAVKNDDALQYIEKYPDVCIVEINEDMSISVNKIVSFILNSHPAIDMDELRKKFHSATSEAVVEVLKKHNIV